MIALAAFLAQVIPAANAGQVKETAVLTGHKMPPFGSAFSPDGKLVAAAVAIGRGGHRLSTAELDGTVQLWGVKEATTPPASPPGRWPGAGVAGFGRR